MTTIQHRSNRRRMPGRRARCRSWHSSLGPVAGAQEHVITGTVLLAFASSWALLATLSMRLDRRSRSDGRSLPAGFMAVGRRRACSRSRRAARSSTRSAGSGRRCCWRCSP